LAAAFCITMIIGSTIAKVVSNCRHRKSTPSATSLSSRDHHRPPQQ
jgi:hypothetical protein